MPTYNPSKAALNYNPRILGIGWVIYGAIRLLVGLWMIAFSGTATVMFGALLTRVPNPYSLMDAFHLLYLCAVVWTVTAGALAIIAGLALLAGKSIGRSFGIIAAFLSLSDLPLGIMLSIYTLIVLLPSSSDSIFLAPARAA